MLKIKIIHRYNKQPLHHRQRKRSTCMKCINDKSSSYHSSNSLASNHHNSSSMYLKPLKTVTSTTTYNKRLLIDTDSSRRWSLNFDSRIIITVKLT
jgi:hypothetical protein